jgi:hypothetical protein
LRNSNASTFIQKQRLYIACPTQARFKLTPSKLALTVTAPGVRFKALEIFKVPTLVRAIVFKVRKSSLDQVRRAVVFAFLAIRRLSIHCETPD